MSTVMPDQSAKSSAFIEERRGFQWGDLAFWVLAIIISILMLLPLYVLVKVSVSTLADATAPRPSYFIHNITWATWDRLLSWNIIGSPLKHSLIVATGTAILAIIIAAPGAYVISRFPRSIRYSVVLGILFTRMFPEVIIATPIASNFYRWGLDDTNIGLILAHLIRTLPLAAWILIGTFEVIPRDLEEASFTDGAGRVGTLLRVVMPLAAPGIVVAGAFAWLESWNDLLYAIYLFITERTLPLITYYYANRGTVTDVATFSVILTIPVIILTFTLQRWIRPDYLSGAVKG
ncbi:MAG TPA: carbohydrate ABC transporter permease [Thermomicrobiales bacterium]|nr:carbohydrate ABC transporter permease [Thermomicrobiales bacterium]